MRTFRVTTKSAYAALALVIIAGLVPIRTYGIAIAPARRLAYDTAEGFSPIGRIESLGNVTVNGRAVQGTAPLWKDDLLTIARNASARINLDNVAEVLVNKGAVVTLTTRMVHGDKDENSRVLIVYLMDGELSVKLQPLTSAYVEAGTSAFGVSSGSSLRIGVHEDIARVGEVRGGMVELQRPQRHLTSTVFPANDPKRPKKIRVNPGTQLPVRAQVTQRGLRAASLDRNVVYAGFVAGDADHQIGSPNEPAVGREVTFELVPSSLGNITQQPGGRTNLRGEIDANVSFASNAKGSGKIFARITHDPNNETATEHALSLGFGAVPIFKRWQTHAAIAAVAAVLVWRFRPKDPTPLHQEPPVIP